MNHCTPSYRVLLAAALVTLMASMFLPRLLSQSQALSAIRPSSSHSSRIVQSLYSTAAATATQPTSTPSKAATGHEAESNHLGLPAPSKGPSSSEQHADADQSIRFDALGPIVVNKDGTMSRITNWDKMAPIERENTLRILGKRNKDRMAALKDKAEQGAS